MAAWQDNLRVVLVAARNSLNIGAAARAMYNFGFRDLRLVRPYAEAFQNARSAAGAAEVLRQAQVTGDMAAALGGAELVVACSGLERRKQRHVQRQLPAGAAALRAHLAERKAALVFGSEKSGLTREDLTFCDWVTTIPTSAECPSMNLGQAVAVCCYEIAANARLVPQLKTPASVSAADRERILQMLLPVLAESGFLREDGVETQTMTLRRFVNRLRLAPEDARMLQGILRQLHWKLRQPRPDS